MTQIISSGLLLFGIAVLFGFGVKLGGWCFDRLMRNRHGAKSPEPVGAERAQEVIRIVRAAQPRRLMS